MAHSMVIAYASKQLKVQEMNFPTNNFESMALVFALTLWRDYLYGVHVDMFIDNKSLKYVFTKKDLNLGKRTWLDIL